VAVASIDLTAIAISSTHTSNAIAVESSTMCTATGRPAGAVEVLDVRRVRGVELAHQDINGVAHSRIENSVKTAKPRLYMRTRPYISQPSEADDEHPGNTNYLLWMILGFLVVTVVFDRTIHL
jgi:hypothetical protein